MHENNYIGFYVLGGFFLGGRGGGGGGVHRFKNFVALRCFFRLNWKACNVTL